MGRSPRLTRETVDRWLVASSVAGFFALGLLFLYEAAYFWASTRSDPLWERSYEYEVHIARMNVAAGALLALLLVTLLLCLERRSPRVARGLALAALALAAGVGGFLYAGWRGSVIWGMGAVAFGQIYYLAELVATREARSEKGSPTEKAGSLVMHAGYALLVLAVGGLPEPSRQIPVFYAASAAIVAGTALSFYGRTLERWARRLARAIRQA